MSDKLDADMTIAHEHIRNAESNLEQLKIRQNCWYEGGESLVKKKFDGKGWEKDEELIDKTLEEIHNTLEELSRQHAEYDFSLCYLREGAADRP